MTEEGLLPTSLSPIKDTFIPRHWIVYVRRTASGQFSVFVDKKYFRLFSLENLPDELKQKLVLIHSVEDNVLDDEGMPPKFLEDVGWRLVSKNWYQFVVSEKLLDELKGSVSYDTVRRVEHDTGRARQEESEGGAE